MRLSTREDVDLPLAVAFQEIANPKYLERQMLRAGVQVVRADDAGDPGIGANWNTVFLLAGLTRSANVEIVEWTPPELARAIGRSAGFECGFQADFTALSRTTTRLRVVVDLKARGFRERLLLHGLQVKKAKLARNFSDAVTSFVRAAERRGGVA